MELIHELFGNDVRTALLVILNLVLIESLLSVDNAAVLATMVMDLPLNLRKKALRYGIIGAYVFRGICLILAAWLIHIWWLKPLGGLYLIYLCVEYFVTAATPDKSDDLVHKTEETWLYRNTIGLFGKFWATVIAVELVDLAFSLDNVFAAVAFTDRLGLIWVGVFIGILAMRFVAQYFVKLMEKYPFLKTSAFVVIGVLGLKLFLSLPCHFFHNNAFCEFMDSEHADSIVSLITVGIFAVPLLVARLRGR